jgi:hypothetical protein
MVVFVAIVASPIETPLENEDAWLVIYLGIFLVVIEFAFEAYYFRGVSINHSPKEVILDDKEIRIVWSKRSRSIPISSISHIEFYNEFSPIIELNNKLAKEYIFILLRDEKYEKILFTCLWGRQKLVKRIEEKYGISVK